MATEMVKLHPWELLVVFMFGFDSQYFKKTALADSENRVEGTDQKPLELGAHRQLRRHLAWHVLKQGRTTRKEAN